MSKITPQARAATLHLVKGWPTIMPLTRRLLLDMLYLVDDQAGLDLPWDTSRGYLNCLPLLDQLEIWGCLATLRKGLHRLPWEAIIEPMKPRVLESSRDILEKLEACKNLMDIEQLSARSKTLWLGRS